MLLENSEVKEVRWITKEQKMRIVDFIQGAVYCWCKNKPDEWFSIRDLMGGENTFWEGTPLMPLWAEEENHDKAGKTAGMILKKVIAEDQRRFDTKKENLVRKYKWIK